MENKEWNTGSFIFGMLFGAFLGSCFVCLLVNLFPPNSQAEPLSNEIAPQQKETEKRTDSITIEADNYATRIRKSND